MLKFAIKRILITIPVLIGVTFIIFSMMYFTPGDPARLILGENASDEAVFELREEMGLNKPFFTQYFSYLNGLLHGDLGTSYTTKMPVADELKARLPVTAKLATYVILFAIVIGIPAGIISAIKQYSILDYITTILALLGITMPNFWLALLLILFFFSHSWNSAGIRTLWSGLLYYAGDQHQCLLDCDHYPHDTFEHA